MSPTVFRGVGWSRAGARLAAVVTGYAGVFAVLWALGLMVRGARGWALVAIPLLALTAAKVWAWQRVCVAIEGGSLRYEGATPRRDFEVELETIEGVYFDRSLPARPLVLVVSERGRRDERVCGELSSSAASALYAHLLARGVPDPSDR